MTVLGNSWNVRSGIFARIIFENPDWFFKSLHIRPDFATFDALISSWVILQFEEGNFVFLENLTPWRVRLHFYFSDRRISNKGLMFSMLKRFLFSHGIARIEVHVTFTAGRSIRKFLRVEGLQLEGTLRAYQGIVLPSGDIELHDVEVWSIIRQEKDNGK